MNMVARSFSVIGITTCRQAQFSIFTDGSLLKQVGGRVEARMSWGKSCVKSDVDTEMRRLPQKDLGKVGFKYFLVLENLWYFRIRFLKGTTV